MVSVFYLRPCDEHVSQWGTCWYMRVFLLVETLITRSGAIYVKRFQGQNEKTPQYKIRFSNICPERRVSKYHKKLWKMSCRLVNKCLVYGAHQYRYEISFPRRPMGERVQWTIVMGRHHTDSEVAAYNKGSFLASVWFNKLPSYFVSEEKNNFLLRSFVFLTP